MLLRPILRLLRIALGLLFLILGGLGLLLPVMPGWLFVALGILALSPEVPFFHRIVAGIENRFPALRKPLDAMRKILDRCEGGGSP